MFPIILMAGIASLVVWLSKSRPAGIVSVSSIGDAQSLLPANPPLSPEAQRLLALLVLFARDKKNPAGAKRFLSYGTAKEAVNLARHLGLHRTAEAIVKDRPIPDDEFLPGRTASIRQSVVAYGTRGSA